MTLQKHQKLQKHEGHIQVKKKTNKVFGLFMSVCTGKVLNILF